MKHVLQVGLLADPLSSLHPLPGQIATILEGFGVQLTVIDPQLGVRWLEADHLLVKCHVVLARANNWEVLCLLGLAEARGIATINRRATVAGVHNKAEMSGRLAAAGIPTSPAFAGSPGVLASACAAADAFPVLVRHIFGDAGTRACIVRSPDELLNMRFAEPWLAQPLVKGPAYDVRLFGIGSDVWSVRRAVHFDDATFEPIAAFIADPAPATEAQRILAYRCQDLFDLDVYGVEYIETPDGVVVLDVDDLADYSGIDSAAERMAHLILRRAGRGRPQQSRRRAGRRTTARFPRLPPPATDR